MDNSTPPQKTPAAVIRADVRALAAYHVPDSRGLIKLDAMENPHSLPASMREEIARLASQADLNRYPDAGAAALKARIREVMNVPTEIDVLLGNGSDELIQMCALAVNRPGAALLSVEPSFVMFKMIATFTGLRYIGVPLQDDFMLDGPGLLAATRQHQPALVFIAYPNNPTGNLFDADAIRAVIEAAPGLVVIDEAYHPFAGSSFLPELAHYPNVLVMRTLSKLGLAGLRLGMLFGRSEWLNELDKLRLPYNVSVLTQSIAAYVLGEQAVLELQAASIRSERARLADALAALPGVRAFPSDANFILFAVPRADAIFAGLKQCGVLIKNLSASHPQLIDCLRVTVGAPAENDQFVDALRASLLQAA